VGSDSNLLIRKVKMISLFVFFGSIVTGDSIIFTFFLCEYNTSSISIIKYNINIIIYNVLMLV
jgi:hypothetical protein